MISDIGTREEIMSEMHSVRLLKDPTLLLIRATGHPSSEEFLNSYVPEIHKQINEIDSFRSLNRLFDLRSLHLNLTTKEIERFAAITKGFNKGYENIRIALICDKDLVFGQIRMFEVFGKLSGIERYVSKSPEDALKWLGIDTQQIDNLA
jgi:hypothetical protein